MIWLLYLPFLFIITRLYNKITCGICNSDVGLLNKVAIVTGANTGIGFVTAKDLARRNAKVILACRDDAKGINARDSIIKETGNKNVHFKQLDLSSFNSVRSFAQNILNTESKLDILINNAGTGKLDNSLTEDNLPIETQVNYFSPFLLTILLLPLLKKSAPSRIINVSSMLHKLGKIDLDSFPKQASSFFQHSRVYSNTKLANVLFTRELHKRLSGTKVTVNCLHPGAVNTDIFRHQPNIVRYMIGFLFKSPWEGAQTTIYLAVSPEIENVSGKYFADCKEASMSKTAQNDNLAAELWELSEKIVNVSLEK